MKKTLHTLALATLTAAVLSACGGGSDATTQAVRIEFAAINGVNGSGQPVTVACGDVISALGAGSGVNAKLTDLRFYVSNLTLTNSAGQDVKVTLDANDFQLTDGANTVALVDLENDADTCAGDTATHVAITGTVPTGTYTGAKFLLGVPEALNHLDAGFQSASTADDPKAPLTNNDMFWAWTSGYKHVKIEVNPESATVAGAYTGGVTNTTVTPNTTTSTWNFHLGNGNCTAGTPLNTGTCASVNSTQMTLAAFNPATQRVAVDLKALFAQSNVALESGGAVGCMSGATDPECQAMWSVLGRSFGAAPITATSLSTQDSTSDFHNGRSVFRAIAK
jgi:uncharacterized repeat protein (TIGR04052 family)